MTVRLDGIDLVIFDKDGTLIDFGPMWSGWAETLGRSLEAATGRPIEPQLYAMLGYDPVARTVLPGGGLAATPMARLRERTAAVLADAGVDGATAERALDASWHAPDPIELARPLTDLPALFGRLRAGGLRLAIATSDDREPSVRTLEALGVTAAIEAMVCADDGVPVKPAPDMVLHLCDDPRRGAGPDRGRRRRTGRSAHGTVGRGRPGRGRPDRRRRAPGSRATGRRGRRLGRGARRRLGDRAGHPALVRQLRPPSRRSMNRNRLMKSR